MHEFGVSLELRFSANVEGYAFTRELSCASLGEAHTLCGKLLKNETLSLVAARIDIDTTIPGTNGCAVLDDDSIKVLQSLCAILRIEPETYWNTVCGTYDRYRNEVAAADFGNLFPDGSIRVVWEADRAVHSLDESIRAVKGAIELLAEIQDRPHFLPTDEEFESGDAVKPVWNRRTAFLFEAGCWPDSEDQLDEEAFQNRHALLEHYALAAIEAR